MHLFGACRHCLGGNWMAIPGPWQAVYHQGVNDVTAFVLAGGKSARMGSDKAFLGWGKQTLLAHSLALARTLSPEALIVGPSAKFASYGAVVEDVLRDRGPLGGIHAALQ